MPKYDCDEMDAYTDGCVEFVLEQLTQAKLECADPLVLIEQRLDFSCWVPEGFGTGDCLIVADKLLHIIDFKYGQGVLVEAEEKLQLARFEFAPPPLLSDEEIEKIPSKLDDLTKWASEIQAYAQDAAVNHGKVWQGFKLADTRTSRRYTDEETVIQAARDAGYTDIFKKSLIQIIEMEKLMGKKNFTSILGLLAPGPSHARSCYR